MSTCQHDKTAPDEILESLHENQAGAQRHKCTECAFEEGYQRGRISQYPLEGNEECQQQRRGSTEVMDALPESQAGPGRHKCCICAYHAGFARGRSMAGAAT